MQIIGVIDLLGGRAVHAKGGCRHGYQPVEHAAGKPIDGDAVALARVYLDECRVGSLYVADLDAIAGGAEADAVVGAIATTGPVWLDAGIATVEQARRAIVRGASRAIVGLETLPSFEVLRDITDAVGRNRVAFSLDLRDGRPVAATESLRAMAVDALAARAVDAGATSVIVLDLSRVGSARGLDLPLLEAVRHAIPSVMLLAGGGVRDAQDLRLLAAAGCDGALVATALHGADGRNLVRTAVGLQTRHGNVTR